MRNETAEIWLAEVVAEPTPDVFASTDSVLAALAGVGYFTNRSTANTVWLAYHENRPLLQEGPAGAGKTQLALSVAKIAGMEVVRLQCYPGINADKAIGHYDRAMQELYSSIHRDHGMADDEIEREVRGRKFFVTGPLLKAIESPRRVVLLIDEVDKVPGEFEAILLQVLEEWEISDPILGTIRAQTRPLTFLTSNAVRDLADPLRRRCFYMVVKHPTALLEGRIVASQTPTLPPETHLFIAGLAKALRLYKMKKSPSISEMKDIAKAMELMGIQAILPEHRELFAPLFAKWPEDVTSLERKDQFRSLITQTRDYVDRIKLMLAVKRGKVNPRVLNLTFDQVREKDEVQRFLANFTLTETPVEEIEEYEKQLVDAKEVH